MRDGSDGANTAYTSCRISMHRAQEHYLKAMPNTASGLRSNDTALQLRAEASSSVYRLSRQLLLLCQPYTATASGSVVDSTSSTRPVRALSALTIVL